VISPKLIPAIILAIAALRGQDAPTVCGKAFVTPEQVKVQVICIPVVALRNLGVPIPPGVEAITQVWVDVPEGALGVAAVLDGEARIDFARKQSDGVRRAMVVFDKNPIELPTIEIVNGTTGATLQAVRKTNHR
jgi:hypothetical protein